MEIPTIVTRRLALRPFQETDAGPLHQILAEEGVLRYFPNPEPPTRERVEQLIARQLAHWAEYGLGWWAVEARDPPGLLGWNGLQYLAETNEVEVGYLLAKGAWGLGLATEGAQASLAYGFESLGLESIVAIVHPENRASQRVAEKLGMGLVDRTVYFGMAVFRYRIDEAAFRSGAGR